MNEFEVSVYEGVQIGYDVVFTAADLMDCYEYIQKWCQNKPWEIHGPDFHDKSAYTPCDLDYSHALIKYA